MMKKELAPMALTNIKIKDIYRNPHQPRQHFDKAKLAELAKSIAQNGLLQPIIVRHRSSGSGFEIVAGERRWLACKQAGLEDMPAIVKDVAEKRVLLESLIENFQREDLTAPEREDAIYEIWKSGQFRTYEHLAQEIGCSAWTIDNAVDAKVFRHQANIPPTVSTTSISETQGLPYEDRVAIVKRVMSGEIADHRDVREMVKMMRRAPITLKQAIAKNQLTVADAKEAVKVIEEVKKETGREPAAESLKKHIEIISTRRSYKSYEEDMHKRQQKAVLKGHREVARPTPPKDLEQRLAEGDSDLADESYNKAFYAFNNLVLALELDSGSKTATNERNKLLREKGWINVFKHKNQKEIEQFIYDYVEVLLSEMKMIRDIGIGELKQRNHSGR